MIYRTLCWLLILFACFYGLGSYPLLDNNEGMYAAVARDMLKSGDFIIPHLNGVPYIEKPPLLYWLMAVSMALFGQNEWAVRLVPALALFATGWKMRRFLLLVTGSEIASLAAPLIFATSLPLLIISRMVLFDMLMTCFLSMALIFFFEWWNELRHCEGAQQPWQSSKLQQAGLLPRLRGDRPNGLLAMTSLCLALAVMAKGFVAIILSGGTIVVFLLWQREPWRIWRKLFSPSGILLFFAITAPWHIAASLKEPGFAWFYFINEHVLRFLNMRQPHDYYTGHWWYYLARIPGYLAPWTLFLALFARKSIKYQISDDNRTSLTFELCPLTSFLWSWFLFCFIFFSLSGAKANYYMLAGMPPLCMLIALRMETAPPRLLRILASIALALIFIIIFAAKYTCHPGTGDFFPTCEAITWPITALAAVCVIIALALCWRLPQHWIALLLGANALLLLPPLISGITMAGDLVSQKTVAEYVNASGNRAAIYQEFEKLSSLAFYLDKPPVIVDSHSSDLLYGQQQLPANNPDFITLAQWNAQAPRPPMVVLNKRLASVMTQLQAVCVKQRFDLVSVIGECGK